MTKKAKREARQVGRLQKAMDKALGRQVVTCSCGERCQIYPLNGYTSCEKCGQIVYRKK